MSQLAWALDWAARGFSVFPLKKGTKTPLHQGWVASATADQNAVRRMWTDPVTGVERAYNIGVLTNDLVVLDVDVKNGKNGLVEYQNLGGHFDTLTVATPSGGYHAYFAGPDSANVSLSDAVDVRSHNGYVVGPGSVLDDIPGTHGAGVYSLVRDVLLQWVPPLIQPKLVGTHERRSAAPALDLDRPEAVAAATNYLSSERPAIEGQGGDNHTFTVAARLVREYALSPDMAVWLLWEHWNPRCSPPWNPDELRAKVENAQLYGHADAAKLDPNVAYAAVGEIAPPPSVFVQIAAGFGNAHAPDTITKRPWMLDRVLMARETTLLLAAGSAGKSSVSLAIVAHMAVGRSFGKYTARVACKSIVYNGEDDVVEQSRRLIAVCAAYGLDYDEVRQNVMLLSADDFDLRIVNSEGRTPIENTAVVNQWIDLASRQDIGLIVYDPMVDVHNVDEGDNPAMNFVMRTLHKIGKAANVASLVLHHTTKAGNTRNEDRVGNMDIARGASAIVYKSRIAFTLINASLTDCETYGLQESERNTWVRMDDAKMNLTLADTSPVWFRKQGHKLQTGDVVGVLHLTDLTKDTTPLRVRIANVLMDTMTTNGQASMPVGQCVAVLKVEEPLLANKTDIDIRKRVEGLFATPIEIRGRTLHAKRDGEGPNSKLIVVMT